MWTREYIKNYAKDFLKKHYWKAFLVCLIATLLSGEGNSNSSNDYNSDHYYNENDMIEEFDYAIPMESDNPVLDFVTKRIKSPLLFISGGLFPITIIAFIIILMTLNFAIFFIDGGVLSMTILAFIIVLITVGFAIEVGQSKFFLRGFKGNISIKNLFSTFNTKEYLPIVKTQFLRKFYNFLWTLLLIIPGIVKYYEYRFVPYILSEKTNLSSNEVIRLSRELTNGHKMDMFVLDLSFIGWYILGSLLFGIGAFFINPYREATFARLYNILSGNDDLDNYEYSYYDIITE